MSGDGNSVEAYRLFAREKAYSWIATPIITG